ncbi:MAG: 3-deoxy-D-manno-octulosonic acid transferase [Duncaniella sp.]|nr:3-deoxy-D-manno-octulosonic acid transferase [Duncaniella sp.]
MTPLYNLAINLYGQAVRLAGRTGNVKAAKMVAGHRDTFAILEGKLEKGREYVWIHAASLGEFEQGRPLIERLRRERPELGIVLSFFSPSGYEVRKNYDKVDAVVYLPFDTPSAARRWVETVNPVMAIFVKYEFWGNYLSALASRHIPTYLISAIFRKGQIFFRPWGGEFRKILHCFTTIFVQDDNSRNLLASIGIDNVVVAGDTRFDRVTDIMKTTRTVDAIERLSATGRPLMVFGSSWPADEEKYIPWLKTHPEVIAVIAPHEFDKERLELMRRNLSIAPGDTLLLSEITADTDLSGVRAVIVDSFGLLSSLYRYGQMAYVGGGFGVSIHNINEAAVYGIPVIFGPKHQKFREAFGLIDCGGGHTVDSAEAFDRIATALLTDTTLRRRSGDAAGQYIRDNLGATDTVYSHIFPQK